MKKLLLVILCMATANAQQDCSMPGCGSEPAAPDDCCAGGFAQIGLVENAKQCGPCPRVFGFSTKELVMPESGQAYTVNVGVLSGSFDEKIELDVLLHLGTARSNDVILHNPRVVISPQQSLAPVRFTLPIDKISQEENETFSLSLSGFDNSIAGQNVTIIATVNITIIDSDVITFKFSEKDFVGREGENYAIPVRMIKQHKVRLANEVTLRVTPLTVEMALRNGTISDFRDEDPLSPSRADENDFDGRELIVTFPADEHELEAIDEIQVDVNIADDDVDENFEQDFIVYLEVINAMNLKQSVISGNNYAICTIVDDDEDCTVGFARAEYEFAEPDVPTSFRNVTLLKEYGCVSEQTFSVGISISAPSTNISAALMYHNTGESYDYSFPELLAPSFFKVTFLPREQNISLSFSVNADELPERLEGFQLSCTPAEGFPTFKLAVDGHQRTQIQITDSDFAVVGFEHSRYTFYEAHGLQEICVQVFNPLRNEELIFDIPLLYWTVMDSADEEDFTILGENFTHFSAGFGSLNLERKKCFEINITNDELHEAHESFSIMLRLSESSRVIVRPDIAEIFILNDDNAVVGFEHRQYTVNESVGVLEVCVVLLSPPNNKKLGLDINLRINSSTITGTADMRDFAVQPSTLHFTNATRRSCIIVQITDDDLHEGTESFLLTLSEDSGVLVSFDPIATEIVILDNDAMDLTTEKPTSPSCQYIGCLPLWAIILIAVVCALLVVAILILLCCLRRYRKNRDKENGGIQDFSMKAKDFV